MAQEILAYGNIEINNNKFYRYQTPIVWGDVDIAKVLVSKKISFGKKTISTFLVTCTITMKLSHYI